MITLFTSYAGMTPGTEVCSDTTILLGDDAEPQPDVFLRILPEYGGQSHTTDDEYVAGAPELVAEIAHGSRAIDLGAKRSDYARHGVLEYVVLSLQEHRVYWFGRRQDRELAPDADGILRIQIFPGLWIDHDGLLARDYQRLINTLNQGLATEPHSRFVAELESRGPGNA